MERVLGHPSAHRQEMARGREEHAAHGRAVAGYLAGRWVGYALLALAAIVGILLIGAAFRGG